MNKGKDSRIKKINIAKGLSYMIIAAGILLLAYPFLTNLVAERRENAVLTAWEDQKETVFKDVVSEEKAPDSIASPEDTPEFKEETIKDEADITDEDGIDTNKTDTGVSKYETLTAEDFFPLKIMIPSIELEWLVYEGTDRETLKNGPGHETITPLPGDVGRCTISGHRTTYGAPFNRVDELEKGDIIYLESKKGGLFTYIVKEQEIVEPTDVWILEGSEKKELLLTACHPKFSAAKRLVVIAELINIYPMAILS